MPQLTDEDFRRLRLHFVVNDVSEEVLLRQWVVLSQLYEYGASIVASKRAYAAATERTKNNCACICDTGEFPHLLCTFLVPNVICVGIVCCSCTTSCLS